MKPFKKILTMTGAVILSLLLAISATGCGSKGVKKVVSDPETRPLVMSIQQPDGVFNPFFSTSAYDSSIISMTQISMLGSDEKGNVAYGDNEPCVVKDYTIEEEKDEEGNVRTSTYKFILKNGIEFSDGTPLTIKDVLFNLYVYLDPAYTGSATVYSTKILGLNKYRTQNPDATDKGSTSFEEGFINDASERIDDFVDFLKAFGIFTPSKDEPDRPEDIWTGTDKLAARQKDFVTVAKFFREELETDWNNTVAGLESYKDWGFTDAWQVFLLNDGGYDLLKKNADEILIKDDKGNYQLDPEKAAAQKEQLDAYLKSHDVKTDATTDEQKTALNNAIKTWAVNMAYSAYFPGAIDFDTYDYDETAFDEANLAATIRQSTDTQVESVVRAWGTSEKVVTQWAAEAKSDYFKDQGRLVPNIEGIDGMQTTTTDFSGKDLGASHEMLCITIDGVDPKAIWNFAFTVAPMHYYSGTYRNKAGVTIDYISAFNQDPAKGELNFGLEFGDIDFMNNVINAPSKVGLPKGAGAYMASKSSGGAANSANDFMNLNMIYYERNPHFHTLGSGINNANIKYLRYRVVGSDQIINSITTEEIDIGDPNPTQDNIRALNSKKIAHVEINTNGYGYVGINPRFVPNINIRRAIMKAMDTQSIVHDYYQGNLAEVIYRPMSSVSWAYPKGATTYTSKEYFGQYGKEVSYSYDSLGTEIEKIVQAEGYTKSGGVYHKNIPGFGDDRLDYEFTIAGSSTDHPLYNVFLNAQKILNRCGFAVKVVTSQTALSDLSTGKLAVWAAAWGSTIDPDMYQVYHMDSQATSVNNWGYKQIKANKRVYDAEWQIIQELSEKIDAGRETASIPARTRIYKEALDLVMELAVEFPTYQRKDMTAYNARYIDESTLTPTKKRSPYNGLFSRIWEVNYHR